MTLEELEQDFWKLNIKFNVLVGLLIGSKVINEDTYNKLTTLPEEPKKK